MSFFICKGLVVRKAKKLHPVGSISADANDTNPEAGTQIPSSAKNNQKDQVEVQPSKAKKIKLFDFMTQQTVLTTASPKSKNQVDFGRAYQHFLNLPLLPA